MRFKETRFGSSGVDGLYWTVRHWKRAASKIIGEFLSILPSISIGQPCSLLTVSKLPCRGSRHQRAQLIHLLATQLSPGWSVGSISRTHDRVSAWITSWCLAVCWERSICQGELLRASHKHPPVRPWQRMLSASRGKRHPQHVGKWEHTFKDTTIPLSSHENWNHSLGPSK